VIDKILMSCEIKKNIKGKKDFDQMVQKVFKPILYHNPEDKNIFYVLYFNKFFEINIDWYIVRF